MEDFVSKKDFLINFADKNGIERGDNRKGKFLEGEIPN